MISERDIIEPVRLRLQDLLRVSVKPSAGPSRPRGPDATFDAGRFRFVVEAKASSRLASVHLACERALRFAREARPVAIPLVAVPIMGPSGRRLCEQAKVSFVDVAGNAHLEAPGLLIHVEGRRDRKVGPGRPASVFAPRSSRVARLLLLDPKRWWRQGEMAERSRLGRGYISRIVARLVGDGLLEKRDDGSVSPRDPDLLLDAWQDEYNFRRHRILAGHIAARSGDELAGRLAAALKRRGVEYAFTGLPAAASADSQKSSNIRRPSSPLAALPLLNVFLEYAVVAAPCHRRRCLAGMLLDF